MVARTRRRGASLVEFALVFPLFLLLLFGLIEVSRGMMVVSLLTNAARTGCRTAILPSSNNADVEAAIAERIKTTGLPAPVVAIAVNGAKQDVGTAAEHDEIKVSVSVTFADVTWLPFAKWMNGKLTGHFSLPHE